MNKQSLTETDIRTKFITPAIIGPATKGRVIVRGKTVKRGESKKADHILLYKPNLPRMLSRQSSTRRTERAN